MKDERLFEAVRRNVTRPDLRATLEERLSRIRRKSRARVRRHPELGVVRVEMVYTHDGYPSGVAVDVKSEDRSRPRECLAFDLRDVVLFAEESKVTRPAEPESCTCCGGTLVPGEVYNGGAGRRLCNRCGRDEGVPLSKRQHPRGKGKELNLDALLPTVEWMRQHGVRRLRLNDKLDAFEVELFPPR